MTYLKHVWTLVTTTALLVGCATARDSILLGGAIGATTGGAVGAAAGPNPKGAAIGAVSGALLGGLFGFLGHQDRMQKETEQRASGMKQNGPKPPPLNPAEVESIWIPDHGENDSYEAGHWLYTIKKPSTFKGE